MNVRDKLERNPRLAVLGAIVLMLAAAAYVAHAYWPERLPKASIAFFSDDDGQTWFTDSAYLLPPFDHNGKQAVSAILFSDGKKQFCGYLTRFTPVGKRQLAAAIADAQQKHQSPASVLLFSDPRFLNQCMEVRAPGDGKPWIVCGDPKSLKVLSVRAEDGSPVEQVFVY